METSTEKKAKERDSIYVPKDAIDKVKEVAELLGESKNDVWERAINMLYPKRFTLADLKLEEKQRKLAEIKAKHG